MRIRLRQHRVKRRHYRHRDRIKKSKQMRSGRTSINAEFMLHAQDIGATFIQALCRDRVGCRIMLIDLDFHARRIAIGVLMIVHRHHRACR